jgi:hypothetical protein
MLGALELRVVKVRDAATGRVTSPILDMLEVRRRKHSKEASLCLSGGVSLGWFCFDGF